MENATIVRLSPSTNPVQIVDFMDAFGEHSELRGKGRARRQARRQARRKKRISDRIERKSMKQEARQARKDVRKTRRIARKEMGAEEEPEPEPEPETAEAEVAEDQYETPEQEEQTEDSGLDPAADENGEDLSEEYFDGDYSEARGGRGRARRQARRAARKEKRAARKAPPVEEAPPEESAEEFEGSGIDAAQFSSAPASAAPAPVQAQAAPVSATAPPAQAQANPAIHPHIGSLTNGIVWNREAARRHTMRRNNLHGQAQRLHPVKDRASLREFSARISRIDMEIQRHDARITDLENALKKYGDHPHIPRGYKYAQTQLQKSRENAVNAQDQNRIKATIVQQGLNPNFGDQRIEVPPASEMRTVDIQSNADGEGESSADGATRVKMGAATKLDGIGSTGKVLIVAGLAIGAFYLYKKYGK